MRLVKITLAAAAAALAAASVLAPAGVARAVGSTGGSLGAGGVARGDVSMQSGETDVVTCDLAAGCVLDVTLRAGFTAAMTLTDPDGAPVDLGFDSGRSLKVRALPIGRAGTYEFAVSSADGSQGTYSLALKPKWVKKMPLAGAGQVTFDFAMPANGKVTALVKRVKGVPGQPQILGLVAPDGSNLSGAIQPKRNSAKLPPTTTTSNGTYSLTVTATDGASAWTGYVARSVPRVPVTQLRLANGLDAVRFTDGVDKIFAARCAGCHSWAASYQGVRSYATASYGRIASGNMPPDGRLANDQIRLIQSWIQTGRSR